MIPITKYYGRKYVGGDCEGILPEVTIIEEKAGHENLGQQNIRTIGEKQKPNVMSQRSVVKDSKEGKSFPPFRFEWKVLQNRRNIVCASSWSET